MRKQSFAILSNVVTGSRTTEPRRWQVAEEMKKLEDATPQAPERIAATTVGGGNDSPQHLLY
ncbi:MAG: hypothetical protein DMG72_09410 [Acidobacteria bacterium]|nr:MAG: hypothetical protein DMG72_09410 [Acidobacteriota bacterium]